MKLIEAALPRCGLFAHADPNNKNNNQGRNTMTGTDTKSSLSDEDTFIERFRPIINHIAPNAGFDFGYGGCLFEIYGEEFAFVCAQSAARIWTLIDADGVLYAESGLHFVNRLGYFVAEAQVQDGEALSFCLDDES
jgi:hypothetical protein